MSGSIFGWSLPPGCSTLPDEEQRSPPQCEDCEDYNEKTEKCPYGDWALTGGNIDFDKCPKVSMIKECNNCKKKINKVIADIPEDCIASGYGTCFCCSPECAKELQDKINKEIEDERIYDKGIREM